jgi:RNA polymerase sigma-70 factor (ECF subfamily)
VEEELLAWLRRMLLNNLVSFTRLFRETDKRQVQREVALDGGSSDARAPTPATDAPSPSGEAIEREQAEAFRKALQQLPEDYQRVILLRYHEGRSFEDIGRVLELSPNAARKLWVRAVKRLQQVMGGSP